MTQRRSENRELNKAGSKPDPFDQPVRTAHTIVHSLIAWNTVVQTERVTLIYPFLVPPDQHHRSDMAKWR